MKSKIADKKSAKRPTWDILWNGSTKNLFRHAQGIAKMQVKNVSRDARDPYLPTGLFHQCLYITNVQEAFKEV